MNLMTELTRYPHNCFNDNVIFSLFHSNIVRWIASKRCMHTGSPIEVLSPEEQAVDDMVRRFAKDKVSPLVREMEEMKEIPDSLVEACFSHGLMGLEVGQEYGGVGASYPATCRAIEELAKVDMGTSLLVDGHNTVVAGLVYREANEQQKQKYLPKLVTNWVGSFCLSEESAGSDAFSLKTRATRDGDDWLINGSKMWTSHSPFAKFFLVMANAEPGRGTYGISCFMVEKDSDGVHVGKRENMLGLLNSPTAPVKFDNVRVPAENLIGDVGMGYKYAITALNRGRVAIAAQMVGVAQGCLDNTIPYLQQREQFGKPIYEFQSLQHQVAISQTRVEAARALVYNTARRIEAGLPHTKQAAMAKYYASEVASHTTSKCIDWMGAVGFTKDYPVEKYYRDCKVGTIYEGTSNMQLNTIAKILGEEYKQN